jgi:hypothetical protein
VHAQGLAKFREELRALEQGVQIRDLLASNTGATITVYGALAFNVGDHPQQAEFARHIGSNATRNCRSCIVTKAERLRSDFGFWDHRWLRRRSQTDSIRGAFSRVLAAAEDRKEGRARAAVLDLRSSELKDPTAHAGKLRTAVGVYGDRECPLMGLTVDPHLAPRDPEHMLDFGIARTLLSECYALLSKQAKDEVSLRLRDFAWPAGWPRITFDLSRTIASRYSMAFTRKMVLVAALLWGDLLPADAYGVLCMFFKLRNDCMRRSHSQQQLKELQARTVQFVAEARRVFGDAVDKPNTHNLLEFVYKDLSLYGNGNLLRTGHFEAYHQGK